MSEMFEDLKKLSRMLEKDEITQAEYDQIKGDLLAEQAPHAEPSHPMVGKPAVDWEETNSDAQSRRLTRSLTQDRNFSRARTFRPASPATDFLCGQGRHGNTTLAIFDNQSAAIPGVDTIAPGPTYIRYVLGEGETAETLSPN